MDWKQQVNGIWDAYATIEEPTEAEYQKILMDTIDVVSSVKGITARPPRAPDEKE